MTQKRDRLIIFKQLREYGVALGRRQIDRLEVENKFPKRVALSEKRVAWVEAEVIKWVEDKIKARSTGIGALGSGDKTSKFRKALDRA